MVPQLLEAEAYVEGLRLETLSETSSCDSARTRIELKHLKSSISNLRAKSLRNVREQRKPILDCDLGSLLSETFR